MNKTTIETAITDTKQHEHHSAWCTHNIKILNACNSKNFRTVKFSPLYRITKIKKKEKIVIRARPKWIAPYKLKCSSVRPTSNYNPNCLKMFSETTATELHKQNNEFSVCGSLFVEYTVLCILTKRFSIVPFFCSFSIYITDTLVKNFKPVWNTCSFVVNTRQAFLCNIPTSIRCVHNRKASFSVENITDCWTEKLYRH